MGSHHWQISEFTKVYWVALLVFLLNYNIHAQPDSCYYTPQVEQLVNKISAQNILSHISNLADAGGSSSRVTFTAGNIWAVEYIRDQFASYPGFSSVEIDTFFISNLPIPYNLIPVMNVTATLTGSGQPGKYYLIGGHLDATANRDSEYNWDIDWTTALAPGADDNASGVAVMLEVARVLGDPSNQFNNDIAIRFVAFGAEESHPVYDSGHKGSGHYVLEAHNRNDDILGAYIIDMVGYNTTGHDYVNIVSNSSSAPLGRFMLQANDVYQIGLISNSDPFPEATYSDHDQFWLFGYDAVLLIENAPPWVDNPPWYTRNPYYHRSTDTPDHVSLNQVVKVARITLATIACLTKEVSFIEPDDRTYITPDDHILLTNFPNPFNPETSITYRIPKTADVNLTVFSINGQKITELVKGRRSRGDHTIQWQAIDHRGNHLPSGVYVMVLRTQNTIVTKKMLYLK